MFQEENPSLLVENWVWPRLDIGLPAVQSLGFGIFKLLWHFSITCYLPLGFSSKVTPCTLFRYSKAAAHVAGQCKAAIEYNRTSFAVAVFASNHAYTLPSWCECFYIVIMIVNWYRYITHITACRTAVAAAARESITLVQDTLSWWKIVHKMSRSYNGKKCRLQLLTRQASFPQNSTWKHYDCS